MTDRKGEVPPKVSIAMATFNGGRFLREQLDSIYAQSWPEIELLVCDDCSSDDTVAILEEYRRSHGLRFEVNDRNLGFVRNFEKVISRCTAEFIALADQDDVWMPDKLEKLMAAIGPASLVYSNAFLIDEEGRELPGSLIGTSGVKPVYGKAFEYFVCNACVTGCTALFRRELLELALPVPECETYHDWWLAVAASRLNGVAYLDARLTGYRQHGTNDTGLTVKTGILSRIAVRFGLAAQQAKRRYYELLRNRAAVYRSMREKLQLTEQELLFLDDIGRYAGCLLGQRSRFYALPLAVRHRESLFPAAGTLERCVYVFSILFR